MSDKRIFSGKESKEMWKYINLVHGFSEPVFWALYILGCRCQELEAIVRRLETQAEPPKPERAAVKRRRV